MAKILLIEDDNLSRDMLTRRLRRSGHHVVIAADGVEGITLARSHLPDVILMDMSLPVLDGWEATRRLKASAETRHIPIIAQTAHVMAGDREKCIAAGCDDYTAKPVHLPQLLAKIEALLLY